jgi:hypothetical protein
MEVEVSFEWDEGNSDHIRRHNVLPEETEQALRNDPVDLNYDVIEGEERWTSVGHTDQMRVLVLVWTLRAEVTRVVTAWEAAKPARLAYLRGKGITL